MSPVNKTMKYHQDFYNYTFFGVSDEWFIMLFAHDSFVHCFSYSVCQREGSREAKNLKPQLTYTYWGRCS